MANKNWGAIPTDVAQEIATYLTSEEDFRAFRHVCCGWRYALKMFPKGYVTYILRSWQPPPLLMLAEPAGTPYRSFYSSQDQCKVRKVDLPVYYHHPDHAHDRYFSSRGWLISLTQTADKITLFNPLSAAVGKSSSVILEAPNIMDDQINMGGEDLEDRPWDKSLLLFQKFILSSPRPTTKDFVAVICEIHCRVRFWRIGHDRWVKPITGPGESTIFEPGEFGDYCDVCFHRGKFYALIINDEIIAFTNDTDGINWYPESVINLKTEGLARFSDDDIPIGNSYLVGEWEHNLILVVYRVLIQGGNDSYITIRFFVFEVNVETRKARKVESLGNRSIYVGFNSAFFVEASPFRNERGWDERRCKPNCIYFTDDNYEAYGIDTPYGGGADMGIYSLDQGKVLDDIVYQGPIASNYSFVTPPMWVENF